MSATRSLATPKKKAVDDGIFRKTYAQAVTCNRLLCTPRANPKRGLVPKQTSPPSRTNQSLALECGRNGGEVCKHCEDATECECRDRGYGHHAVYEGGRCPASVVVFDLHAAIERVDSALSTIRARCDIVLNTVDESEFSLQIPIKYYKKRYHTYQPKINRHVYEDDVSRRGGKASGRRVSKNRQIRPMSSKFL